MWRELGRVFNSLIERIKTGAIKPQDIGKETKKFLESEQMDRNLRNIIGRMVRTSRKNSLPSWREAAAKFSGGQTIYHATKNEMNGPVGQRVWQLISENVAYIKTLPYNWADYASKYAYRETLKGKRPEEVEAELRKIMPESITKNLKTIARTECAKANAAIAEARAEACGIRAYIWRSVRDERSRDSHAQMDGVLIFYDDPPSPEALFPGSGSPYGSYHAGNTFNCRCFQEPVVSMAMLPDVIRVHRYGEIRSMTKGQIMKEFGDVSGM